MTVLIVARNMREGRQAAERGNWHSVCIATPRSPDACRGVTPTRIVWDIPMSEVTDALRENVEVCEFARQARRDTLAEKLARVEALAARYKANVVWQPAGFAIEAAINGTEYTHD